MLRNAIETLAQNYDTPINKLEEYKNIVEENLNHPDIYSIIDEQFRPTIIKVGTAGSYLWGCNQNYYGNVSKSCSALCNGGLIYNNSDNKCQYQIWTYDEELTSKGEFSNSKAYIYVNEGWKGFKSWDIDKLKNRNVLFATVLTTENSQHKTIIPITSVDNLPIIKDYIIEKKEDKSYWVYYIIFIILISYLVYMNYHQDL